MQTSHVSRVLLSSKSTLGLPGLPVFWTMVGLRNMEFIILCFVCFEVSITSMCHSHREYGGPKGKIPLCNTDIHGSLFLWTAKQQ
jgi:hypothetical protein